MDNSRFRMLAQNNAALTTENKKLIKEKLDLSDKMKFKDASNDKFHNQYNHQLNQLSARLNKQINDLSNLIKVLRDSLTNSNSEKEILNEQISLLVAERENIQSKLDSLPDVELSMVGIEILPFKKGKSIRIKNGNNYSAKNIGTIRVNLISKKIKDGASSKEVFVQYIINYDNQNSSAITIDKKFTQIQGEKIEYSNSITLWPSDEKYLDFSISKYKLSKADHIIKLFHDKCNLNEAQTYKFSTY
ncbi:MAG: hypothetical protein ABIO44_09445, partial [Saprospiraceae bacterium]